MGSISYKTRLGRTESHMIKKYINYYSLSDTAPTDDRHINTTIKWIHLTDSSMRIEAIISGQAVMTNQHVPSMSNLTQSIAVQPASSSGPAVLDEYCITPLPHTIVVIKHIKSPSSNYTNERRSRRAGRLSRKFISNYIAHLPDDDECCVACPTSIGFMCCRYRSNSPTRVESRPIMC